MEHESNTGINSKERIMVIENSGEGNHDKDNTIHVAIRDRVNLKTSDNPNVVDDGDGKNCSSCIDNGCTKELDGNVLKWDKCRGITHFYCTGIPTYLLFLFSSKGYKRFRCKKCVGNVPHEFDRFTKRETIDEDNMVAMRRELGDKDEVIASLKVAHDTLKKLSDDKDC